MFYPRLWDLALAIVTFLGPVGLFTHSGCSVFRSSDFIRSVCFLLLCSVGFLQRDGPIANEVLYFVSSFLVALFYRNVSDRFPIRNGLKLGDALTPMLFNFALQNANMMFHVNQDGLKLNGIHQLLSYADDINILAGSIHILKENTELLVPDNRENGLKKVRIKLSTLLGFEVKMQYENRV